jgi:hypothetical protein
VRGELTVLRLKLAHDSQYGKMGSRQLPSNRISDTKAAA